MCCVGGNIMIKEIILIFILSILCSCANDLVEIKENSNDSKLTILNSKLVDIYENKNKNSGESCTKDNDQKEPLKETQNSKQKKNL